MTGADVLPERAPVQGELVQVRSRRWLVEGVETTDDGRSTVLLACADDDAQGEELAVLWDYEIDRRILDDERWDDLASRGDRRAYRPQETAPSPRVHVAAAPSHTSAGSRR